VQRQGVERHAALGDDVEDRPVAVLRRRRVRIEIDEHEWAERLDPDRQQRKVFQPEAWFGG
jgi:predicted mannosyl-3-phosphoglycerate phosphatase (HAD superfamily)